MTYTTAAVVGVVGALVLDLAILRTRLVSRRAFWVSYAIVLAFQLVVNGVLTGLDYVVYARDAILGVRVVNAPIEDVAFGFSLVLQTLVWWVWWGRRQPSSGKRDTAGPSASAMSGGTGRRPPAASA